MHDPGDADYPDLLYADGWEPTGDSYALSVGLTGQDRSAAVIVYRTRAARPAAIAELARRVGVHCPTVEVDLDHPGPHTTPSLLTQSGSVSATGHH